MQPIPVDSSYYPIHAISFPSNDSNDELNECSICLDSIHPDDQVITTCNHIFHKHCLEPWLEQNKTCGYCREPLPNFNINQLEKSPIPITCNIFQIEPIFNIATTVGMSIYNFLTEE